jgi:hypothetical protein
VPLQPMCITSFQNHTCFCLLLYAGESV